MEFYNDKHFLAMVLTFLLFTVGIAMVGGWILLPAILVFGFASLAWKESHIKISALCMLVLLALINIYIHGMNFGIDFVGGTRIPVILDHPVDDATMGELVQTIKSRASTLGLKEVKARAVGSSLVNVEIASTDEATISFIERTLSQQGVYQGIVDGTIAVSGDHIFRTSIRPLAPSELLQQGASWGVAFSVDKDGADTFAQAAKGKNDYPIYMFIDRPTGATIFYERSAFKAQMLPDAGEKESIKSVSSMLYMKDNASNIDLYVIDTDADKSNESNPEFTLDPAIMPKANNSKAIVSENATDAFKDAIKARGFTLVEVPDSKMKIDFQRTRTGVLLVNKLEATGLLTAPLLGGGITSGVANYNYIVTGGVTTLDPKLKATEAADREKEVESILKGGALPVQISLGSRTTLPAALGKEFLNLSMIAIVASLLIISVAIGLRYRNLRATMPIVAISMAELVVLVSLLGSFTIDLAAMAGIIAAIGVGVDAQIVITDELLKKDEHTTEEKVDLAFGIIKTNAIVAIFSMVPLLFSGLVEIIGFAMSTMLGALLGYLLTRPAYATLVEKVLEVEKKEKETKTSGQAASLKTING